jgi:hypothetical protein
MGKVNEEICVGGFCCEVASRHPGRSSPSAGSWGIQGSLTMRKAEEEGGGTKKGWALTDKVRFRPRLGGVKNPNAISTAQVQDLARRRLEFVPGKTPGETLEEQVGGYVTVGIEIGHRDQRDTEIQKAYWSMAVES